MNSCKSFGTKPSTAVILGAFTGGGGTTGGGDIFFEGDLRPGNSPATVTFDNNVGLGSTANLEIELGGNTPGAEFDRLRVTGNLTLGGTLDVSLINLGSGVFEPQLGNVFEIAAATEGIAGSFAAQRFPDLGVLLDFRLVQQTDKLLLAVVPALTGDYNANGVVDGADYVVWRKPIGQTGVGLPADGDGDGDVDVNDHAIWRAHFGETAGSGLSLASTGTADAIPEPASVVLIMVATAGTAFMRVAARCHKTAIRRW